MAIISSKSAADAQPPSKRSRSGSKAKTDDALPLQPSLVRENKERPAPQPVSAPPEDGLRPQRLTDYIGQKSL